jgi:hypothetical protein
MANAFTMLPYIYISFGISTYFQTILGYSEGMTILLIKLNIRKEAHDKCSHET